MSTNTVSPFRIALAYAIAGLAAYQGYARPELRTLWYVIAALAFITGVVRTIRYMKAKPAPPSDTQDQL